MLLTAPRKLENRSDAEILAILDGNAEYSDSGQPITTQRALQQATVFACVRILAEVISQLPLFVQTRNANSTQWQTNPDHDLAGILQRPNETQTGHEFISHLVMWSELRGNAFCRKTRNVRNEVVRMFPLQSDDVETRLRTDNTLSYRVSSTNWKTDGATSQEIFHLRNVSTDGYMGLSTISLMRNTVGLALSTEQHGNKLFKNGATPGMVVTAPSATQDQIEALQRKIDDKYAGSANSFKTMILRGDMKMSPLSMTQGDAQYLETRQFSKQEIASIFGVPLFILNDTKNSTTWGTGLEQQLRAFKTISLGPRMNRATQTLRRELVSRQSYSRTRFMFDTDALTLGDFKDRMEGYRAGIESGVLSPDEAREIEGRNPRDGGDSFRKPLNIGIEGEEPAMPAEGDFDESI